jgi:uncharacterized protein (TIGR00255 family)
MQSMTGYGRGECARGGYKATVELSSVNRKQAELQVILPRELEVLEAQVRDVVNRVVSRGKVTARIMLHAAGNAAAPRLLVNRRLAQAYARELRHLARELKLEGPLTIETLARAPGVLEVESLEGDAEAFWPVIESALNEALNALLETRAREGGHLAKDLSRHIQLMRMAVVRIEKRAPSVQERYRRQLMARLKAAGLPKEALDDERLLKELVLFADRSDISEELARLKSHFKQFDDCMKSSKPVGRMLDFLAQEINREVNTIGSKANDAEIAREVVILKTELEKFREQAMNVE